jgi:uncharacterized protein (DUF362 family)
MSRVARVEFTSYEHSIGKALDLLSVGDRIPQKGLIIIKPNLTNTSAPPVTTPVEAVEAVYRYCLEHSKASIAIGEGAGSGSTLDAFEALGYTALAQQHSIQLIDFNTARTVCLRNDDAVSLKEFHLPELLRDAFVISLPVLKDHCFTVTTIAMKNMFGIAPAPVYGGSWNKSKLHRPSSHISVVDVCLHCSPSLSIVDASVALSGGHLSGTRKPLGLILASFDPVAADAVGSSLLGHDPGRIEYLVRAHGRLGSMKQIQIVS